MKRSPIFSVVVVVGVVLLGVVSYLAYQMSDIHARREQYAVYSAFLREDRLADLREYLNRGILVILDHSEGVSHVLQDNELPQVTAKMRAKLNAEAHQREQFEYKFELQTRYKLISSAAMDKNFQIVELSEEERRMSYGGYVTFSRVIFNRTATVALFYTELRACPLCGDGKFVLMKKSFGRWKIVDTFGTWSS